MMRDLLNAILLFIGSESLTDEEFDTVDIENPESNAEKYEALLAVLNVRSLVGGMQDRLRYYFLAKGIVFGSVSTGQSTIFVGGRL